MLPERKLLARAKTTYHTNTVSGICVRPWDVVALVTAISEIAEKLIEQRMNYLLTTLVEFKAAFSWIGDGSRFMNEYMVPRLVPVRLGFVGLVPIFISQTLGVMRYHHATIMVTDMTNQIARHELGRFVFRQV